MLIFKSCSLHLLNNLNLYKTRATLRLLSSLKNVDNTQVSGDKFTDSLGKPSQTSVVLRKPVPTNFIMDTLIPHIEHSVTFDSHKIPPHLLIQLSIAYSKLPYFLIQKEVADRIIDVFIYRMSDYGPCECVQILNTSFQIQGLRNIKIYESVIKRLEDKNVKSELNTLNRLGIARTLSRVVTRLKEFDSERQPTSQDKISTDITNPNLFAPSTGYYNIENDQINLSLLKPWTYIKRSIQKSKASKAIALISNYLGDDIIPTLVSELESYTPTELSAILSTIADNSLRDNTRADFPVIAILISTILKKYPQTSLLHNIANISSLCKLHILHPTYLSLVEKDLKDKYKTRNLYHKHLAKVVWVFSRYNKLDDLITYLEPKLDENLSKFDSRDFARLAQALGDCEVVSKLADRLSNNLYSMPTRDFIFYYIGCVYSRLIDQANIHPPCHKYMSDKHEEFDLVDINRLVSSVLKLKRNDLLEAFPAQWSEIIKTTK